ncbi:BED zinc finger [Popillia japonica]|uniref:BED zinc finger n=1 Tax=Popillia japonica TaxID=7064 RepID=A0AAW1LQP9_POPJA
MGGLSFSILQRRLQQRTPFKAEANAKNSDPTCDICNKSFKKKCYLASHKKVVHENRSDFVCGLCNRLFLTKATLEMHETTHTKNYRFKCDSCDKGYYRVVHKEEFKQLLPAFEVLRSDKEDRQIVTKGVSCDICGKTYSSKRSLWGHMKFIHKKKGKQIVSDPTKLVKGKVPCDICGKIYSGQLSLKKHIRDIHEKRINSKGACDICNKSFRNPTYLAAHKKVVHENRSDFICGTCGKLCLTKATLEHHETTHTKDYRIRCDSCGKGCYSFAELEHHRAIKHKGEHLVCEECGKQFIDKSYYKRHVMTHKPEYIQKMLTCQICNKSMTYRGYKVHMKKHNIKDIANETDPTKNSHQMESNRGRFACNICSKRYRVMGCLKNHIREVHEKGKVPGATCDICNRSFKNKSYVVSHKKVVHENRSDFVCEVCNRLFLTRATLEKHEMSHTKNYKFKCDSCDKGYYRRAELEHHQNVQHKGEYLICDVCGKKFMDKNSYKGHLLTHKPEHIERTVTCEVCNKVLAFVEQRIRKVTTDSNKTEQMKNSHQTKSNKEPVYCNICGKRYYVLGHLENHVREVHEKGKVPGARFIKVEGGVLQQFETKSASNLRYLTFIICRFIKVEGGEMLVTQNRRTQCSVCYLQFPTRYQMFKHKEIEHTDGTNTCEICNKNYLKKENLKKHIKEVHELGHVKQTCEICNKSFKSKRYLLAHKKVIHEGESDYVCSICGHLFINKPSLEKHTISHTKNYRYKCDSCDKGYYSQAELDHHKSVQHEGEYLICAECGKKFADKRYYKAHLLKHQPEHVQEKIPCEICNKILIGRETYRGHIKMHKREQHVANDLARESCIDEINKLVAQSPGQCVYCKKMIAATHNLRRHLLFAHYLKTDWSCDVCEKTFPTKIRLRNHKITAHVRNFPFKCDKCGRGYLTITTFREHVNIHHCGLTFTCAQCNKSYRCRQYYKKHVQKHLTTPTKEEYNNPYEGRICLEFTKIVLDEKLDEKKSHTRKGWHMCEACAKEVYITSSWADHLRLHIEHKSYFCKICPESFSSEESLKTHMEVHEKETVHKCMYCGEIFNQIDVLLVHIGYHLGKRPENSHVKEELITDDELTGTVPDQKTQCIYCHKILKYSYNLQRHLTSVHYKSANYACEICDRTFSTKAYLRKHKFTHLGNFPFRCDKCQKGYVNMTALKDHERVHHGGFRFKCATCNKSFRDRFYYNQHIRTHEPNFTRKNYTCGICSKILTHKNSYKVHMKIHTGRDQHMCEVCGKEVSTATSLADHMRVHTGEKPYTCEICGKGFSNKKLLKTHVVVHTKQKAHKCTICGKSFTQRSTLVVHTRDDSYFIEEIEDHRSFETCPKCLKDIDQERFKEHHTKCKYYICAFCEREFDTAMEVMKHVQEELYERNPYQCRICACTFRTMKDLIRHYEGSYFVCEYCGMVFPKGEYYGLHILTHRFRTTIQIEGEVCELCTILANNDRTNYKKIRGERFEGRCLICHGASAWDHIRLHSKEGTYVCEVCGQDCVTDDLLEVHKHFHTDDNTEHICKLCGKRFPSRNPLLIHTRFHTGKKPYHCGACQKKDDSYSDEDFEERDDSYSDEDFEEPRFFIECPKCLQDVDHNQLKEHNASCKHYICTPGRRSQSA